MIKVLLVFSLLFIAYGKRNNTVILYTNGTSDKYLPDELFENYQEYTVLEENNNTCNIESFVDSQPLEKVKLRISQSNCIPDHKSFAAILDNGWLGLSKDLVVNQYLENLIDPTSALYRYIGKHETKIKYVESFYAPDQNFEKLVLKYDFDNADNTILFRAKMPDEGYVLEHYSVFCYKDMFKLNAVVRRRNKLYKVSDSRTFYDLIEGDCEHSHKKFTYQVEINLNKLNKYKRWATLFR
jgi:hypothetical protein